MILEDTESLPFGAKRPAVDFSKRDLQDSVSKVTAQSVLKDYGRGGKPKIYKAWLSREEVPDPQLAEEMFGEDEIEDGPGEYSWEDFSFRGVYPPAKILIDDLGSRILDGNHRITYWLANDMEFFPAWVLDYRTKKKAKRKNPDESFRKHERAARMGSVEEKAKVLIDRVRRGELDIRRVAYAAALGHEVAEYIIGNQKVVDPTDGFHEMLATLTPEELVELDKLVRMQKYAVSQATISRNWTPFQEIWSDYPHLENIEVWLDFLEYHTRRREHKEAQKMLNNIVVSLSEILLYSVS